MANNPRYIIFNHVTGRIEQTETAPNFGDPNTDVQNSASVAYSGSTTGASSVSSGSIAARTPSVLGNPAAAAMAAAQANLTPQQAAQVSQCFGSIGQMGQLPSALGAMHAHAQNVIDNGTRIFDAIDTWFKPNEVGTPGRCQSVGDYIGSVQGRFNNPLTSITSGLGQIANVLVGVPLALITGVVTAANSLITAIATGVATVIGSAISAVCSVVSGFFDAVGTSVREVFDKVGSAVKEVFDGITAEINNVSAALSRMTNNPLRVVAPNVNNCLRTVLQQSNPDAAGPDFSQLNLVDVNNLGINPAGWIQFGAARPS